MTARHNPRTLKPTIPFGPLLVSAFASINMVRRFVTLQVYHIHRIRNASELKGFIGGKTVSLLVSLALLAMTLGCIDTGLPELKKPALLEEERNASQPVRTPTPETPIATATPTLTPTPPPSPTPTQKPSTPTPTSTPTDTPTPTYTYTSVPTQTPSPTGTPTVTSTPTSTPVVTPTVTPPVCGYVQMVLMGAGKKHDPCYTPTPTP